MKMRNWIVKVMKAAPENLQAELEVSAPTIDSAMACTRQMMPDGFVWSIATKKPKAEEISKKS